MLHTKVCKANLHKYVSVVFKIIQYLKTACHMCDSHRTADAFSNVVCLLLAKNKKLQSAAVLCEFIRKQLLLEVMLMRSVTNLLQVLDFM